MRKAMFAAAMGLVASGLVGPGACPAHADFTMQLGFAIGPNGASGSPSYPQFQMNAVQGISNGFSAVGNLATDPTAFQPISSFNLRDVLPSGDFNSWDGVANPTGAFANELGNLLYAPVAIQGNGTQFSLSQVVFTGVSSDDPSSPAGSLLGNVTDLSNFSYSAGRVGVIFNNNAPPTYITSGSPDQKVDELIYRGVGSFDQILTDTGTGMTGQQVLDQQLAQFESNLPLTFTATYSIYSDTDSTHRDAAHLLFSGSDTISAVPEPSSLALLGLGGLVALGASRRRGHRTDASRAR
jgi:hypothetical protein